MGQLWNPSLPYVLARVFFSQEMSPGAHGGDYVQRQITVAHIQPLGENSMRMVDLIVKDNLLRH
jgi:hypothetical protein